MWFFSGGKKLCTFFNVFPLLKIFWGNYRKPGQDIFEWNIPTTLPLSSWTKRRRTFSLTQQWLCQKPLITSLCLSSQITKQYSHYASGERNPNTLLLLECAIYSQDQEAWEVSRGGLLPKADSRRCRVAGDMWLCSVILRIRESRSLYRIPGIVTQKKEIFST